jgi:hypothetical protein
MRPAENPSSVICSSATGYESLILTDILLIAINIKKMNIIERVKKILSS